VLSGTHVGSLVFPRLTVEVSDTITEVACEVCTLNR